ncbi:L-2-hydroxyglutarate oxidase [Enterobacillus tribolii]|uniref:L-2-hydroxyglutarate oxidase n=1 Tax=Enterobacillus tribolii TaxID=1487935 RepID=A0A370QQ59_9GAMM|nr:L-2-hydroxyglutarate oxidase [Enterobacillus tribolii]MBW7981517.1 L-2-hydroxyglutarate oxidase [Enterobacillus tribolii]RDK90894.1 L-2-hydroxyglutarate oxidase [Enterobacillus tribolii]
MYDFIIVGGGIVGLSTAMQLIAAYPEARIALLEKEARLARHQTGRNSGVIHAGLHYLPGSLKARFCRTGNMATRRFCDDHNIRYDICGKLLVATNAVETERLHGLHERAMINGLGCEWLDAGQLSEREPNIRGKCGLFSPDSGIVDYAEMAQVMARTFCQAGGEIFYNAQVRSLNENLKGVLVSTTLAEFETRYLVGCAGLMADRLVKMLDIDPGFTICPFRGEYYRLSPQNNRLINHLIYPVPDPALPFLGVHLTRTMDGSIIVGPSAVLAFKREGYRRRDFSLSDMLELAGMPGVRRALRRHMRTGIHEMKNALCVHSYLKAVRRYCPSISLQDLQPCPSGVRAQAIARSGQVIDDFLFVTTRRTVHVCNAPSPAATSAIPVGGHTVGKVRAMLQAHAETMRRLQWVG